MPADNVTPFRRPPKRPVQPQQRGGIGLKTHRGRAVLVHLLTLATYGLAFFYPFPQPPGAPLVAVILSCGSLALALLAGSVAVANRTDAMPWAATHHEHALRTLFIGYAIWVISSALRLVDPVMNLVALVVHLAIVVWVLIRSGVGLVLAVMRRPIWHPKGWLL